MNCCDFLLLEVRREDAQQQSLMGIIHDARPQEVNTPGLPGTNWNLAVPLPKWFGVSCTNFKWVTRVSLRKSGLDGTLPQQSWALPSLESLDLGCNLLLHGPLPQSIGQCLGRLKYLDVGETSLSGMIPASLGKLTDLVQLTLSPSRLKGEWMVTLSLLVLLVMMKKGI